MTTDHTSVPRWPDRPPPVEPAARTVSILAFGAPARAVAAGWAAAAGARGQVFECEPGSDVEQAVRTGMAGATVGWRMLLAGPEAEVLRARAEALRLGAVPAEIAAHVTDTRRRRVSCLHCGTVTTADVTVGGTVPCVHCGRLLYVYHHVSRLQAAYMGFQADAEEA